MGWRKCKRWDKIIIASAINFVSSEEIGLKKSRCLMYRDRPSKRKLTARKQIYINWSICDLFGNQCCPIILKKTWQLLSDDGEEFFGLTTKSSLKAFELAIKMALPGPFQYNKGQQTGSGCVNLCVDIFDWGWASPKLLLQQAWRESRKQTSQNISTYLRQCCGWLTFLPFAYSAMTKRVLLSFSIKYANSYPLKVSDGSLRLQLSWVHSWYLLPALLPPLRMFLLLWCFLEAHWRLNYWIALHQVK
jgi:hypothetical protein